MQEHLGGARSNTIRLSWNANPESDVVGYEVVWRDSIDANWTHVIPVGDVTDFTAASLNRDATLFGVRAINGAATIVRLPSHLHELTGSNLATRDRRGADELQIRGQRGRGDLGRELLGGGR